MPADRTTRSVASTPVSQLHVAGHGFAVAGPDGLNVQVGQIDADLLNLAPDAAQALKPGGYNLQVRSAEVRLDAASLSHFLSSRIPGAKDLKIAFEAPDRVTITGRMGAAPFNAAGRLVVSHGQLGFAPTRVSGPVSGLQADISPQTGRAAATITDKELARRMAPAFASAGIENVTLALQPGGVLNASGSKKLAGQSAKVSVSTVVSAGPDGKVLVAGKSGHISWDGLEGDVDLAKGQGHIQTTDAAVNRWLARLLPATQVRQLQVAVKPGNRVEATMQVKDASGWHPLTMSGKLDVADGGVRITPEHVTLKGISGGVDVDADPRTGHGRAVVPESVLNEALAPVLAQNGIQRGRVRLLPGNQFELTGVKAGEHGAEPLVIRGSVTLEGPDQLRIKPQHLQLGARALDMDSFGAGVLHFFGWHLDHEMSLRTPFAEMDGDTLLLHPSKLPAPMSALLDGFSLENGRMNLSGQFKATLRDFWRQPGHVQLQGNTLLIRSESLSPHLAGRATGLRTGDGTIAIDATVTAAEWKRMVTPKGRLAAGVSFDGDRARLDLGALAGLGSARVSSVTTAAGAATVEMRGDPATMMSSAPALPGLKRSGATWLLDPKLAGLPLTGPVTLVRTDAGGVTIDVGNPGPAAPGTGFEGHLAGRMSVAGIVVEDAVIGLDLPPNAARQLTLSDLPKGRIRVTSARAAIPTPKLKELLAQYLPPAMLGGYKVSWAGDGLAIAGRYAGLTVTGKLMPAAGQSRGLALAPEGFHWGVFPVPHWLAARIVAGQVKGQADQGRVYLDPSTMAGVALGPITALDIQPDGLKVTIGNPK